MQNTFVELDRYRQQSEAIDALRDRVLDPVLSHLAHSRGILDKPTQDQTKDIVGLDDLERLNTLPSRGVASAKHAWLRGTLTSIGLYLLAQTKKIGAAGRDAVVKEAVAATVRHSDKLLAAMMDFLEETKTALLSLANSLVNSFGWIRSLLDFLGL